MAHCSRSATSRAGPPSWDGNVRRRAGVLRNVFPAPLGKTLEAVSAFRTPLTAKGPGRDADATPGVFNSGSHEAIDAAHLVKH